MSHTVEVTELCLRDGYQSLLATRMAMEDMAPICEEIDPRQAIGVSSAGGQPTMPASAS